jgi:hypothetical protein
VEQDITVQITLSTDMIERLEEEELNVADLLVVTAKTEVS